MSKTDDILERLKGIEQPINDDFDALTERIMDSLPPQQSPAEKVDSSVPPGMEDYHVNLHWVFAAAIALLIIGFGLTKLPDMLMDSKEPVVAQKVQTEIKKKNIGKALPLARKDSPVRAQKPSDRSAEKAVEVQEKQAGVSSQPVATELTFHYASLENTVDSNYQAPSRMDEFIAKMANYHQVEAIPLNCAINTGDSTIVNTAYVFEDKQEFDLFGRLLQMACWYDTKTPGYLLNFSRQQFYFCLKDLRKGMKYLWLAERINGERILLYSTHSPIDTTVSSNCFQEYREQLTHTNIKMLNL